MQSADDVDEPHAAPRRGQKRGRAGDRAVVAGDRVDRAAVEVIDRDQPRLRRIDRIG